MSEEKKKAFEEAQLRYNAAYKDSRAANKRAYEARDLRDRTRAAYLKSIPLGAGQEVAEGLPWLSLSYMKGFPNIEDHWYFTSGCHIDEAKAELPLLARVLGHEVFIEFNSEILTASPTDLEQLAIAVGEEDE